MLRNLWRRGYPGNLYQKRTVFVQLRTVNNSNISYKSLIINKCIPWHQAFNTGTGIY